MVTDTNTNNQAQAQVHNQAHMAAANPLQISPFYFPPKPNTTSPLSLLPPCTSLRELKQNPPPK